MESHRVTWRPAEAFSALSQSSAPLDTVGVNNLPTVVAQ